MLNRRSVLTTEDTLVVVTTKDTLTRPCFLTVTYGNLHVLDESNDLRPRELTVLVTDELVRKCFFDDGSSGYN